MPRITYDRPVEAELHVHLSNGETFKARPEDFARFGLVPRLDAYALFDDRLSQVLRDAGLINREVTEAYLNPLRWLVELAVCMPDLLTHPDAKDNDAAIAAIEQTLRDAADGMPSDLAGVVRDLLGRLERTDEVDGLISHLPAVLHPNT